MVDGFLTVLGGGCVLVLGMELYWVLICENLLEAASFASLSRFAALGCERAASRLNIDMAWTKFYSPSTVRQLESDEIQMQSYGTQGITAFQSVFPVRSISTSFGTFTRQESNSIVFTGFGMPDAIPVGVQVRLVTQRLARIQDKVIQLWDGSQTVGENKQNLRAGNDQLYGGDFDRWGLKSDYAIPTASPDFGVVVDLQPHTEIPCSDTVYIRSVTMRLYLPE